MYGFTSSWTGSYLTGSTDTVLNQSNSYGYDEFGRLTSLSANSGQPGSFTYSYTYDRWGNRWDQTLGGSGSGPQPKLSFDTSTNQIQQGTCSPPTANQYCYDAAGNMVADSFHTYTYDAEGNVTQVDGGTSGTYTYDERNHRVRIDGGGGAWEFLFDINGERASYWDVVHGWQVQSQTYWGTTPVEFNEASYAQFQHQDWLGTERMRTRYNNGSVGTVDGTFSSLPYGDDYSVSVTGNDNDLYHFAGMDGGVVGSHAQFREYSSIQGNWMAPDPYSGSYDFSNPQSFNRYAYVLNAPLSFTDPRGLMSNGSTGGDGGCGVTCGIVTLGIGALIGGLEDLFNRPSFHGSLHPRPNGTGNPNWGGNFGESLGIGRKIPTGNWGIAQALGLPNGACEFGACGAGPTGFSPGSIGANFSKITIDPRMLYVADALYWAFTGKHSGPSPRIHGNWCGPGGAGFPVDSHDWNCMFHDYCYNVNNLSASDNLFIQPPGKRALLHGCNQALCNAESKLGGWTASEINGYFSIIPSADNGCTQ